MALIAYRDFVAPGLHVSGRRLARLLLV